MDPNRDLSALSAGQLTIIAVVAVVLLAGWLISMFLADRDQARHSGPRYDGRPPDSEAGMTLPPSGPGGPAELSGLGYPGWVIRAGLSGLGYPGWPTSTVSSSCRKDR
jgi:hypothetical protein